MDNVQCFCKLAKHRTIPAAKLERAVYEKALLRMIMALMSVYAGLFPTTALGLYERAAEHYTQPLAGDLHVKFIRPVTLDIMERLRLTATKACSHAEKAVSAAAELDTPDKYAMTVWSPTRDVGAKIIMDSEGTRTNPVDVVTYFQRGHAQSPYYCTEAFRWYTKHVQLADDDTGPIPDSGDDVVAQAPPGTALTKSQKRKARRDLDVDKTKSPLIDLGAGKRTARDPWLENLAKVGAAAFKSEWTQWYTVSARCPPEKVQCPYFVFTDYMACPREAPCIKLFEHRTSTISNPSATQCEAWLADFFRRHNGLPVDILTRLRPRWSAHLIQQSLLPTTYAQALPKNPRAAPRTPHNHTNNRKKRGGFGS